MISIYWPYKRVPSWLEVVKGFRHGLPVSLNPIHKGFGLTVKANGEYYVWAAAGTFMYVNGKDSSIEVKGGGSGVNIYFQLMPWLKAVYYACKLRNI